MKQAEDTLTHEMPELGDAPAEVPLGDIARSIAGLPPLTPQQKADLAKADKPAWWVALMAAIDLDKTGKKGVAERLGVSRPYVSRVACGHIRVPSQRFIDRVTAVLLQVECPHLGKPLKPDVCRAYAARTYGQVSQFEVDHWRACRGCKHNPENASKGVRTAVHEAAVATHGAGVK